MKLNNEGFEIHNSIFTSDQIDNLIKEIDKLELENTFGNREFLFNHTKILELVLTQKFLELVNEYIKNGKIIKSIYFDKPPSSNWIVNWHQDLTINLKNKIEEDGYKNWRKKGDRIIVQPPINFLKNIVSFRIHLDNCTSNNGALRVVPKSNRLGEIKVHNLTSENVGKVKICEVEKGGVLLMKPLTLHSSKRSENKKRRRVIHIEIANLELPKELEWKESICLYK